jgi:hypothetical protein
MIFGRKVTKEYLPLLRIRKSEIVDNHHGVRLDVLETFQSNYYNLLAQLARYSQRSAAIGSTRAARRAGTNPASAAAQTITATATPIATGSAALNPNNWCSTTRPNPHAAPRPSATPTATIHSVSRIAIHSTLPCDAPSAMRIPISLVRRAIEYDITP